MQKHLKSTSSLSTLPKRTLGVFALVMINIIAVDSLRSLPFSAVYGFSLVFYYLLVGLLFFIPVALVSAELATGWPNKGGVYVWVREAFGPRWGFIVIWLQWIYNVVWYPTILIFMAGVLAYLVDPQLAENKVYMFSVILTIFWGATLLNCFGMRISSWVSTIGALIGTLIPMFFIIILGIAWVQQGHPMQIEFTWKTFFPQEFDIHNLSFLLVVFFGLVGMEMSATHADEVKLPGKSFPRAIAISVPVILFSLILSALAIAIVVPHNTLNVVTGLVQAFQFFFQQHHMPWMSPIMTGLIVIGGIGSVAAWIIGPTKGLLIATIDGSAPAILGKINRHGVPVVILFLQATLCTLLCSVFLLMPTVSSSYWVLTAITAQLAMLVYVILFPAAIYLRYKKPEVGRDYTIPFGKAGIWVLGVCGSFSSLCAIALGFIPPSQMAVGSIVTYEMILVVGIIIFCLPPLVMYAVKKKSL
jgi:amino acid transporter